MDDMRATTLFARALGKPLNPGDETCFWCGCACDQSCPAKLTGTFWDWDVVANPHGKYQCVGCAEALDSKREMAGRDKLQRTWTYSWLITEDKATPWTKADIAAMRETVLNPPKSPWALAIAESGQKHILFRTPINTNDVAPFVVQLELIQVSYHPRDLSERIDLCGKIAAACGKPSLAGRLDLSQAMRVFEHHGDEGLFLSQWWETHFNEPQTRLAAFLSLSMEDAKREYPPVADAGRGGVSPAAGRPGRCGGERSLFA